MKKDNRKRHGVGARCVGIEKTELGSEKRGEKR